MFVVRNFQVLLNQDSRLGLKKTVEGNFRAKIDYDGNRQDGSALYNLNLSPDEIVNVFQIEYVTRLIESDYIFVLIKN